MGSQGIAAEDLGRSLNQGFLPGMNLRGMNFNRLANSATVSSPWRAAKATLALNAGLCFFLLCFIFLLLCSHYFRSGALSYPPVRFIGSTSVGEPEDGSVLTDLLVVATAPSSTELANGMSSNPSRDSINGSNSSLRYCLRSAYVEYFPDINSQNTSRLRQTRTTYGSLCLIFSSCSNVWRRLMYAA